MWIQHIYQESNHERYGLSLPAQNHHKKQQNIITIGVDMSENVLSHVSKLSSGSHMADRQYLRGRYCHLYI